MTVEEAVIARLYADLPVKALVNNRIYQLILPQDPTLPAIRVQLIDEPEHYHLRGVQNVYRARVQTDAFGSSTVTGAYGLVVDLADAVNDAMRAEPPYEELDVGSPVTGVSILGTMRDSRRVMYEAEEIRAIRVLQDFMVIYRMV